MVLFPNLNRIVIGQSNVDNLITESSDHKLKQ